MNTTIPVRPFALLKLITLAALALAVLLLSGCRWAGVKGNGDIKTETRQIADFTTLEAHGAYEVTWTHGAPALEITADSNLLKLIDDDLSGKKLRIEWEKQMRPTRQIKVRISSSTLIGAELNGAVRLNAANMRTPNFFLEANGATRVDLRGTLDGLSASMNGASRLDAEELQARVAELVDQRCRPRRCERVGAPARSRVRRRPCFLHWQSEVCRSRINGAGRVKRCD
jgi:hypothetical protein